MIGKIRSTKDKVLAILKTNQAAREDDTYLFLRYLSVYHDLEQKLGIKAHGKLMDILLDDSVPCFESVRRSRQLIQSQGLYLGANRRKKLEAEKEMRKGVKSL